MTFPAFDGFRIVAELGSGSMSTVYKAVEEPLGRLVALKVLKSTIAPSSPFAAQLEREAQMLADLSHSNITVLHGFVKTETQMYLILEHVEGFSLADVLAKAATLPPDVAAAIGAEVAHGLAHAHEHGIVHRDIKPGNVLLSQRGDVKIADFGIAQRLKAPEGETSRARLPSADEPITKLGDAAAFGTPAYMSPEQILGEVVDARSDIFSLGVVLYQMLSGTRPFEKEGDRDRKAAAQRIRRDPPAPLHRRVPEVPRALERVVMRALEKLPVDRYAQAGILADQLEEFLTARGAGKRSTLVLQALARAGLIAPESGAASRAAAALRPRASARPSVIVMGIIGAVGLAGGAVIQYAGRGEGYRVQAGARPLELLPPQAGALRVLATPWAEVWIDGQKVETTPFARAIPLTAGTHYLTLVHPKAPAEKRTITIAAGETLTIDVTMMVEAPPAIAVDAGAKRDAGGDAKATR